MMLLARGSFSEGSSQGIQSWGRSPKFACLNVMSRGVVVVAEVVVIMVIAVVQAR